MLIPHTLEVTTLGGLEEGEGVNVEVDMLGKYVRKLLGREEGSLAEAQRTRKRKAEKKGEKRDA